MTLKHSQNIEEGIHYKWIRVPILLLVKFNSYLIFCYISTFLHFYIGLEIDCFKTQ